VDSTKAFRNWLTGGQTGFVSMLFAADDTALDLAYDWKSCWNFEAIPTVMIDPGVGGSTMARVSYSIGRPSHNKLATTATILDSEFREVPNFSWRETTFASKYTSAGT
jgi:hypothetical protein